MTTTTAHNTSLLIRLLLLITGILLPEECFSAQLFACPQTQIKFEKLIGIKPNIEQRNRLLYQSNNNTAVTLECITKCANDPNCSSFLLYYNTSECFAYTNISVTTQNYDYDTQPDTGIVWFRKTCLNVPNSCRTKAWTVEIVSGATLIGHDMKRIAGSVTRQQCIELCMNETSFLCKSVKFNIRTNIGSADPTGVCILSETDRHLTTNGYRVSRYDDEYIENECVNTTHSLDYCAYEEYEDTRLEHTDLQYVNMTQEDCQNMCDISLAFNCRGYSLIPEENRTSRQSQLSRYTCLLHSEDSKLIGPKLLIHQSRARYYERARCLNVSVACGSHFMTIEYQPEEPFSGRVYTYGNSEILPCYGNGFGNNPVVLNIPLGNDSVCGLTEAHTAEPWNRTLKTVLLVIQYNALIQTQSDRLIKIGCIYGSDDDTEVTLGTTVNFTTSYPNHGSTVVNNSTVLPTVTMRIVDFNTKQPTTNTEIGQELQMIIEITPGNGPYDIWAGNLVATSGNNTLQLLDENGCPTALNIFSPFTKIRTNASIQLVSNFQAFKFPTTSLVRFNIMVHFCTLTCPPMQCLTEATQQRRKRATTNEEEIFDGTMNATVYKIDPKYLNNSEFIEEMRLNILLYVRGVNLTPDQLVVDENNRILIAGYDIISDEVCINYSLFMGLLVTWVLLQVIIVVCCFLLIRKYKKYFHIAYTRHLDDMHQNFGYGNRDFGRRVHWADQ